MSKFKEAKKIAVASFEQSFIMSSLITHQWNISRAAKDIGIDRKTVHRMIKKHNLSRYPR